jgi:hypothetical protein
MARKSKQLERLEQDREGRAYLMGFRIGYCLATHELRSELHQMIGNELDQRLAELSAKIETAEAVLRQFKPGLSESCDGAQPASRH